MTHDAAEGHPLDLRDLREAETLGRAWDTWLHDDLEPTRHTVSQGLPPGLAATVEDIYDWDDSPGPSASFRRGLKRDLLHVHDALRLGAASGVEPVLAPPAVPPRTVTIPVPPAPVRTRIREKHRQPSRPERRWWPVVEFAAATIVVAALFGITFGNHRIAEFFRDDDRGRFAATGDETSAPGPTPAPTPPQTLAETFPPGEGAAVAPEVAVAFPAGGSLESVWMGETRNDEGVFGRPDRIAVADGLVAVVSSDDEAMSTTLTLFDQATGERRWTAQVNEGVVPRSQGRDSTPIIADGKLYFVNRAAYLYVFDLATYSDTGGLLFAGQLPFAVSDGTPVLLDGVVYVAGRAFGGESAQRAALTERDGLLYLAGDASTGLIGVDPGSGAFTLDWSTLPVDPELGRSGLWQIDPVAPAVTDSWQSPDLLVTDVSLLGGDRLAVTIATRDRGDIGVSVRAAGDIGTEIATFEGANQGLSGDVVVVSGAAIITTFDPEMSLAMYAYNPDAAETPRLFWDYRNVRNKPDPVIGGDDTVVIADNDAIRLYDPATGVMLGETPIGTTFGEVTALDTAGGAVFAAFENGTIVRFAPREGMAQVVSE